MAQLKFPRPTYIIHKNVVIPPDDMAYAREYSNIRRGKEREPPGMLTFQKRKKKQKYDTFIKDESTLENDKKLLKNYYIGLYEHARDSPYRFWFHDKEMYLMDDYNKIHDDAKPVETKEIAEAFIRLKALYGDELLGNLLSLRDEFENYVIKFIKNNADVGTLDRVNKELPDPNNMWIIPPIRRSNINIFGRGNFRDDIESYYKKLNNTRLERERLEREKQNERSETTTINVQPVENRSDSISGGSRKHKTHKKSKRNTRTKSKSKTRKH